MNARAALELERYADGACIACGILLDDVSLSHGYERCGACEEEHELTG